MKLLLETRLKNLQKQGNKIDIFKAITQYIVYFFASSFLHSTGATELGELGGHLPTQIYEKHPKSD